MDLNEFIMFKFYAKVFEDVYLLNSWMDKVKLGLLLDTETNI